MLTLYPDVIVVQNTEGILLYSPVNMQYVSLNLQLSEYGLYGTILLFFTNSSKITTYQAELINKKLAYEIKSMGFKYLSIDIFNHIKQELYSINNQWSKSKDRKLLLQEISFLLNTIDVNNFAHYHYSGINSYEVLQRKPIENITLSNMYSIINSYNLLKINLLGKNVIHHSFFENLLKTLNKDIQINVFITYSDFVNNFNNIKKLQNIFFTIYINISSLKYFDDIHRICKNEYYDFYCVVENERDYLWVESKIIQNSYYNFIKIIPSIYAPIEFLSKYISYNRGEILTSPPTQAQIFRRMLINDIFFGHIIIDAYGNILSSFMSNVVGNINHNSLPEIIDKLYTVDSEWNLSRNKILSCKDCLYNLFCPPVSYYEMIHNRTFCTNHC